MADVLDDIDDTIDAVRPRCVQCRHPLGSSPSDFWCGDMCQKVWHQNRAADAAWARYQAAHPPGLLATVWNLLTRPWRKP